MIDGQGKCLYRVLRLAAFNAARRFASRGLNARGRRDAWRPMVLRWRLRRKRLEHASALRAAPQSKTTWFPQFHLHFVSNLGAPTRRDSSPAVSPAANSRPMRVAMDHRRTSVPTATASPRPSDSAQPRGEVSELNRSRTKEQASKTAPPLAQPPAAQELVAPSVRQQSSPRGRMPDVVRWRTQREGQTQFLQARSPNWPRPQQVFSRQALQTRPGETVPHRASDKKAIQSLQTRSQVWQHWQQVFSLRRPPFGNPISHRTIEKTAMRFQNVRHEELVWREVFQTPLKSEGAKREAELSESRAQARSQTGHEPAADVAAFHERAAAAQVTKFDPVVLDRLADDVISRVEKRMRIERQRRGL